MNKLLKLIKRNSPVILSFISTAGVVGTAVSAAKATPKALKLIEDRTEEKGDTLTKIESVMAAGSAYVPTLIFGASTIACIFGISIFGRHQQASLISAYTILNKHFSDYKRKVKEMYGEEAHEKIEKSIIAEKAEQQHIYAPSLCLNTCLDIENSDIPEQKRTFCDCFTGRIFESTLSQVIQAEYHLNRNFMFEGTATLNDFYKFLGIDKEKGGDDIGWSGFNSDIYWIDFNHEIMTLDDGMEVVAIDMIFSPTTEFLDM